MIEQQVIVPVIREISKISKKIKNSKEIKNYKK
jgi:hypothetical protein